MNCRELVQAAIHFRVPERMPVAFESLGYDDTAFVGWNQIGSGDRRKNNTYDEWDCGWVRTEVANMGQVKHHPLPDWSYLARYRFPDADDPAFYAGMAEKLSGQEHKYVMTGIFMLLFERLHALRGFAQIMLDLRLERGRLEALADRIVDFDLGIIGNIAGRFPAKVQGFSFTDDWGDERSLLISPDLWREVFRPRYQRIFGACHEAGWDVWMHSCGKINAIIGDLIEAGVDVLNLQQPRLLGIEEIGRQFAGKVCFFSSCDIQRTLPNGSDEDLYREAKDLIHWWGTSEGGFILADDRDNDEVMGITMDRRRLMYEAFMENDRWRKARRRSEDHSGV